MTDIDDIDECFDSCPMITRQKNFGFAMRQRGVIGGPSASKLNRGCTSPSPKCDLDLDLLDCPICMTQFKSHVYQCGNGHLACSACWTALRAQGSRCPSCSQPIGSIRNVAIEKILESLQVSCKYVALGCNIMLGLKLLQSHQKKCEFEPLNCPFEHCNYCAPRQNFFIHFKSPNHHGFQSVRMESKNGRLQPVRMELGSREQTQCVIIEVADSSEPYLLHRVKMPHATNLGDIFFITSFGKRRQYSMEVCFEDEDKDKDEDEDEDEGEDEDEDIEDIDDNKEVLQPRFLNVMRTTRPTPFAQDWESNLKITKTTTRYSILTHTVEFKQPMSSWKKHHLFIPNLQPSGDLNPKTFNISLIIKNL